MTEPFPDDLIVHFKKVANLRYGENPHQQAALYSADSEEPGIAGAMQLHGKELSYNNLQDADAALQCVAEFQEPACVIVKHMNPCGVALGTDIRDAYRKALACDRVSAFGGIVAFNQELTAAVASDLVEIFLEVVIAPSIEAGALEILTKKQNLRILTTPIPRQQQLMIRSISGGFLVQTPDAIVIDKAQKPHAVTKREPTPEEWRDIKFAFEVAKHVKSNAIVYAKGGQTLGIGAGQMSRIYSAKIAALKAQEAGLSLAGAVMASDAFMPFPDCVEAAHEAGATAIVQPGGSLRDQDSIDAADTYGMAMIFTGIRHFRH